MTEFNEKQNRIHQLLADHKLDALLLQRVSSFAWATCGASSFVNTATTDGASSLLITPTAQYVITNNIEATRIEHEEKLGEQGWQLRVAPWYKANTTVAELTLGLKLGADGAYPDAVNLASEMSRLRANLTPEEGERFRVLGRICADAMRCAIHAVQPGQTEHEIAARLGQEAQARGAQPIVNLIATDERIFRFRHPLPTDKKLDKYAMLVLCGRKWGLVCSITRLVHFGKLPDVVRHKMQACARIDATLIAATRPGEPLNKIFQQAVDAYAETGFANEWQLHHQGGPAGYEPREWLASPTATDVVNLGQAYAWNPSITGTKLEDTILVRADTNEAITSIADWQMIQIDVNGKSIARPAILQVV